MMSLENIEQTQARQNKELLIRNNPLSLYPESLDSLLEYSFPPTRWIVEGLIPSEGLTIMSAMPGSFKTWIMLEIALSVAQGRKLFNQYPTELTGVLIVDEESGARMLNERFKQLNAIKGLPVTYFSREGHKISQEYIDSLISVCLANNIGLVVFDSLVRLHQGDENTSKDMSELFNLFKKLADNGISVLIAHHNRKGIPGSYNPSGDMRGSSDILAAVDCHLAVNRNKNSEYVEVRQTKNRYMRELPPFKLRFIERDGYSEFQFVEVLETKNDQRDKLKLIILEQLSKEPDPTKKDLLNQLNAQGVDIKLGLLGDLLEELKTSERIDTKPGVRNAIHYFVTENTSTPKNGAIYE
jgi:hypothetical protein